MITLRNVTIRRGANVLIERLNWTIYAKQRIGLIGANGAGKTSLFSLLLNELHADNGDVEILRHVKLAHVAQETAASSESALDYVLAGDAEWYALQQQLLEAEAAHDGMAIATIYEQLGVIDGYTAPSRAAQLLAGLGFDQDSQQQSVSSFSGGWRVRLNLAKALMCRSDVLLLDEPTNHLDLDAVLWLEAWLLKYQGTLILISHDRDFLDHIVDHIAHISHRELKLYTGDYSQFEKQRAEQLMLQQAAFEKQQKHIAHMQSFVNRFRAKASKATQAQSRLKAIERLDIICAVQTESEFSFEFKQPGHCPNPLISVQQGSVAYGDHWVLKKLNLSITPKDRIGVLGPNGAGKSSLIKLLADELAPATGSRDAASSLRIGYFAQHQVDHLNLAESPLEHLRDIAGNKTDQELRGFLGSFGFRGERIAEPVKQFSGGEKSRLALALIIWQNPHILLLDEPTNHLDMEMRNALSIALQAFEGAMLLVSHDRFLLRSTTDQFWLVADHAVEPFDGDLDNYQRWLLDYRKTQNTAKATVAPAVSRKEQRQMQAQQRGSSRPLLQKIQKIEKELGQWQHDLTELELVLTDNQWYEEANKEKLQENLMKQAGLKKKIEQGEVDWMQLCEERDQPHE